MKKFLSILVLLFVAFAAYGQAEKSILIDQNSFRPVQTDELTGVGVDEIAVDDSRRPCARIKVRINRMTLEDVNKLEVKIATNNQLTKCRTADYGIGLIIEMTAKPQSRFYFSHPEFGVSNEVLLNLEANKEYYIDAYLNQSFSIVVNSNVEGANVYLDNVYKGQTAKNFSLTISEVMIGDHTLRVEYGNNKYEQKISVNKSNILFRQNVNTEATKPQFVVLTVEPKNAVVTIDGKLYVPEDGVVTAFLETGAYNYTVSAKNYHQTSGTLTVAGEKIEKPIKLSPAYGWIEVSNERLKGAAVFIDNELVGTAPVKSGMLASGEHTVKIVQELYNAHTATVVVSDNKTTAYNPTLKADFANVTINAFGGAEIWINGEKKGTTNWTGRLSTGTYLFEARKAGHKTTSLTKNIASMPSHQIYNLEEPTAITSGVVVTSSPAMADVSVDGKVVGRTPISLDNLLVGDHTIVISKEGYAKHTESIKLVQGKSLEINVSLHQGTKGPYKVGDFYDVDGVKGVVISVKGDGYTGTIVTIPQSSTQKTRRKYKIGDVIEVNGVKGVVFALNQDGYSGKVVSVTQSSSKLLWSKTSGTKIGLKDEKNGKANCGNIADKISEYPAFEWCKNLGEGWYLPAKDELSAIYKNKAAIDRRLSTKLGSNTYWSSTEYGSYVAYTVGMKSGRTAYYDGECYKASNKYYVRAVATFDDTQVFYPKTHAPYKVGDFYNEDGKQGVVFMVDGSGRFGKIVHLQDNVEESGWHYANTDELEAFAVYKNKDSAIDKTLEVYGVTTKGKTYIPADIKEKTEYRSINHIGDRDSYRFISQYVQNNAWKTQTSRTYSIPSGQKRAVYSFGCKTKAPYKVGDFYNENGKQGVVISVDVRGETGVIVSFDEPQKGTQSDLVSWCRRKGSGWRMPDANCLQIFAVKGATKKLINANLGSYGTPIGTDYYIGEEPSGCVKEEEYRSRIAVNDSYQIYKTRAVYSFGSSITRGPYKVGDYYNEYGKEGVVFEVSADGMHGKIVYLRKQKGCNAWLQKKGKMKAIGATDENDGENNMKVVRQIANWQNDYKLFATCDDMNGYYLPAINELKKIWENRDKINRAISNRSVWGSFGKYQTIKEDEFYGSSTESDKKSFKSWCTYNNGYISTGDKKKYSFYEILPVAKF